MFGFPTAQDCLRGLQNSPKTAQEAPKSAPSRPKTTPRSPKRLPRGPQDGAKSLQEGTKTAQRGAQDGLRRRQTGQEPPKTVQDAPGSPGRLPRGLQEALQESPKKQNTISLAKDPTICSCEYRVGNETKEGGTQSTCGARHGPSSHRHRATAWTRHRAARAGGGWRRRAQGESHHISISAY